ncbi:glycosyltransferase [Methylocaldum sp. 14B]|jgi:glycosyltransferase involved in cell wall biosynthesis|uniref:glycosyltransferase n=1 Tax=Methylocaldum sp. 14B TaxID=1912213 RepID=UPI000989C911|nr:glycosyltransferase [Methylocaldum sp. 14B]
MSAPKTERLRPVAVFLCEDLPVPGLNGYSTYNHAFVKYLESREFEAHLVISGPRLPAPIFRPRRRLGCTRLQIHVPGTVRLGEWRLVTHPRALIRSVYRWLLDSVGGAWARRLANWRGASQSKAVFIGRCLSEPDLRRLAPLFARLAPHYVFVDTIFRARIVNWLPNRTRTLLIAHDVFYKRCQSLEARGITAVPPVTPEQEQAMLGGFDVLLAISDEDALDLGNLMPIAKIVALPAPVDARPIKPRGASESRILYLGSHAPHNVDGLRWFLENVWPRVREVRNDFILDVAGEACLAFTPGIPGVVLHGRVQDLSELAATALFAINPVRAGSGMKIKMLDYFAFGLPCITTSVGAAGFPPTDDSPLEICDDPVDFAAAVLQWGGDQALREHLRKNARRYVERFSIDAFFARLDTALDR